MTHIVKSPLFQTVLQDESIAILRKFNIRHVEQLASLLLSSTGREAVKALNLGVDLENLIQVTDEVLEIVNIPGLRMNKDALVNSQRPKNAWMMRGMGHWLPHNFQAFEVFSELPVENVGNLSGETTSNQHIQEGIDLQGLGFSVVLNQKPYIIYQEGSLPPVKDQKYRGTCVAFATTALLEAFITNHIQDFSRSTSFSEQYLYYRAKGLDPERIDDGTQFEYTLQALQDWGICSEHNLTYRGFNDWSHSLLFEDSLKRSALDELAKGTRIKGYLHLPKLGLVESIKDCIRRKIPVGIGVLVFHDAWYNDYAVLRGEIELPVTIENDEGKQILMDRCTEAHAIAIYGYQDDENPKTARPGGGSFIFRNSWGEDWASNNENARGYGNLPYAYVEKYCLDACIITELDSTLKSPLKQRLKGSNSNPPIE